MLFFGFSDVLRILTRSCQTSSALQAYIYGCFSHCQLLHSEYAAWASEMLVSCQNTTELDLNLHHHENIKYYIKGSCLFCDLFKDSLSPAFVK
jgi:uncharacterized protein YuzB (UPF0349 family)